jgi:uncharacterized protein (DUF433 family)
MLLEARARVWSTVKLSEREHVEDRGANVLGPVVGKARALHGDMIALERATIIPRRGTCWNSLRSGGTSMSLSDDRIEHVPRERLLFFEELELLGGSERKEGSRPTASLLDERARARIIDLVTKPLITADPKVMLGKPVVAGTRITVELILEKLADGESIEQILDAHPRLTEEGIRAAIAYALGVLRSDIVYPLPGEDAA